MEVQIIFVKLFKEEAKDFIVAEIMPFIEVILLLYFILLYSVVFCFILPDTILYCILSNSSSVILY